MKWPSELLIIRHGQSMANVRKDESRAAFAAGKEVESAWSLKQPRDQDSPLSDMGVMQARLLGKYLAKYYPDTNRDDSNRIVGYRGIEYIIMSPYIRTRQTTEHIISELGYKPEIVVEERIREIEFGVLDGLTRAGCAAEYPREALRREREGKYFYRPSGGENRPDCRLRCHSFLGALSRDYSARRVLISAHSVIVLALRNKY